MQRSFNLVKNCFNPSKPLFVGAGSESVITTIVIRPMSSFSTANKTREVENYQRVPPTLKIDDTQQKNYLDSILNANDSRLPEGSATTDPEYPTYEELRRYVTGLSHMDQGKLRPATSFEQVILHFHNKKNGRPGVSKKVKEVLEKKAYVVTDKSGNSVVEWNYGS